MFSNLYIVERKRSAALEAISQSHGKSGCFSFSAHTPHKMHFCVFLIFCCLTSMMTSMFVFMFLCACFVIYESLGLLVCLCMCLYVSVCLYLFFPFLPRHTQCIALLTTDRQVEPELGEDFRIELSWVTQCDWRTVRLREDIN